MRRVGLLALAACAGEPTVDELPEASVCAPEDLPAVGTPTWSADVAPIVAERCVACHADGRIAPLPLQSFADAAPWATSMAQAVRTRTMPPWPPGACATCPPFEHARVLSEAEIATIVAWADAGAPEGDPVPALEPPADDGLARVDAVLDPAEDYTPPADRPDTYRCFVVPAPTAKDAWLTAYRVIPGDAAVVHHVLVFTPDDDDDAALASAIDRAEDGPGYTCFGDAAVPATFTAGWAPGVGVTRFPEGTGLKIPGGRPLIVQVHYNVLNGTAPDRTRVELTLAPSVTLPASIVRVTAPAFELPPGEEQVVVEASAELDEDDRATLVWGVAPHMHELGTRYLAEVERPGQDPTCLVDLPRWDFHWQALYFYEAPVRLEPGDRVRARCVYDTRGRETVTRTGEGTQDEMCVGFAYVTRGE